MKIVHPYFDSEWSYSQLKLPDENAKVCFVNQAGEKKIIALARDGRYYVISFEKDKQGQVLQENYYAAKPM